MLLIKTGTAQRKQCCTLLLLVIGSLLISFGVMFSYWYFLPPYSLDLLQTMFQLDNQTSEPAKSEIESESYLPAAIMPKELKLRRGAPFIYHILH